MTMERIHLALADLEQFDPNGGRGAGDEGDWCCPLCGGEKRQDVRHRSLSANRKTGAWRCHRCGGSGLLKEFWTERETEPQDKNTRARKALRRQMELRAPSPSSAPSSDWRKKLPELVRLGDTEGAHYLTGRGISADLAHKAGVRYAPRWEHWAKVEEKWALEGVSRRVVFPLRDRNGALVGMQGRAIGPDEFGPKMMSKGSVREGVFITPGALEAEPLVICEAPVDALSLFVCGLPAVGTTGINALPDWLVKLAVGRRVLIAVDADEEGERAAGEWAERFAWSRQVDRLRPEGVKDWNELLQRDPAALRALCTAGAAWDGAAAWEKIRSAYQALPVHLAPEGGIGWATAASPDLLAAVDEAEAAVDAAWGAEDRPALETALEKFLEAHRAVGAAFTARSNDLPAAGDGQDMDDAALLALFGAGG